MAVQTKKTTGKIAKKTLSQKSAKAKSVKSVDAPDEAVLNAWLGKASKLWVSLILTVQEQYASVTQEWRPSKTLEFGRYAILRQKDRTLLYLLPDKGGFRISVVLGERAYGLAMATDLRSDLKSLLQKAKPYAEGRGIRFSMQNSGDTAEILTLMACKMAKGN